jgi:hypothetical protein
MSSGFLPLLLGALSVGVLFRSADPFRIAAMRRAMRCAQLKGLFLAVDSAECLHRRGLRTRKIMASVQAALQQAGIRRLTVPVAAGQGPADAGNLICVVRGFPLPLVPYWLVLSRLELYLPQARRVCGMFEMVSGVSAWRLCVVHGDAMADDPLSMIALVVQRFLGGFVTAPATPG